MPPGFVLRQLTGGDGSGQDLLNGERQTVAVCEQLAHGGGQFLDTQAARAHVADLVRRQVRNLDLGGHPPGGCRVEQVRCARRRTVAQRYQAQDVGVLNVVGEVLDDRDGLRIRPAKILDEKQSAFGTGLCQQPQDRFADDDGLDVGLAISGAAPFGDQRSEHLPIVRYGRHIGHQASPGRAHECLGDRTVGNRHRRLSAPAGEDHEVAGLGERADLPRKP